MMKTYPRDRLDPDRTTGLILCGMGGPDTPEAVEPFLRNLFQDPALFPLPRIVAGMAGRLIAKRRAPKVRKRYAQIYENCETPQLKTTMEQASILAKHISDSGRATLPGVAMRYWHPFPDATVATLMDEGVQQFLVTPTYPHYSGATNGSTLDFVLASLERNAPSIPVYMLPDWHLLPGYIDALAQPIINQLLTWADDGVDARECVLLYVAHSLPESFIRRGDPYLDRIWATVDAVHDLVRRALESTAHASWFACGMGIAGPRLVFQSKVGPIRWLGPQINEEVPRLAAAGCRRLMVQPVSFTCEHIETMMELDIELKEQALGEGIVDFQRGTALNLNATWLDSLASHLTTSAFGKRAAGK